MSKSGVFHHLSFDTIDPARYHHHYTLYRQAIDMGTIEDVKALIQYGFDVNSSNCAKFTPLIVASRRGDLDVVNLLLDNKADINAVTDYNGSALYEALSNGHFQVAKYLVGQGADTTLSTLLGDNAIKVVQRLGWAEFANYMIQASAMSDDDHTVSLQGSESLQASDENNS